MFSLLLCFSSAVSNRDKRTKAESGLESAMLSHKDISCKVLPFLTQLLSKKEVRSTPDRHLVWRLLSTTNFNGIYA